MGWKSWYTCLIMQLWKKIMILLNKDWIFLVILVKQHIIQVCYFENACDDCVILEMFDKCIAQFYNTYTFCANTLSLPDWKKRNADLKNLPKLFQLPIKTGLHTTQSIQNVEQNKECLISVSKHKFSLVINGLTKILQNVSSMVSNVLYNCFKLPVML